MDKVKDSGYPKRDMAENPTPAPEKAPGPEKKGALSRVKLTGIKVPKLGEAFGILFKGTFSKDGPTRRMSWMFILSLVGLVFVTSYAVRRHYQHGKSFKDQITAVDSGAKNLGAFLEKQSEEAKRKYSSVTIGKFTVDLKNGASERKISGVMNMVEIEIVAQCDTKSTCDWIEEHALQTKNEITNTLVGLERDDILSKDGKRRLKKALISKLNSWLPAGKVEEVFFSKLVVS